MFICKHALRIFVLAMAVIMLMSISAVSAREASYNFNTKSPVNATLRSLMLPGWGQFFNEQPTKGLIFAGAELIAVGTAFMMYSSANSAYSDYETQRTTALYDDYSSKIDTANMFVYASAAIWIGNIIDAYLSADSGTSAKSEKKSSIKKSSKKKKVEVEEEIEEEEEESGEDQEEEDDESRLPERGFYLQAKGLHQLGIAYRYTF
jgi:TM2 domain-containing membrane protein YozV